MFNWRAQTIIKIALASVAPFFETVFLVSKESSVPTQKRDEQGTAFAESSFFI